MPDAAPRGDSLYIPNTGMGDFKRAVSCLSFSRTDGGTLLASVEDSPDHLLAVWDWARGNKQIESKVSLVL